jgi:cytoskeleton protein RodZ
MTGEEQSQPASEASVGQQLRRAREKLGLSVSDIADQQHLRSSVIQSIEEGDYSKVDTELFLKGYVRTYARQVKLDADALIAALDSELEPLRQQREQEQQANPLVDIERKKKRKRQIAKLVVLLAFLGVVGFLAYSYLVKPVPEQAQSGTDGISESAETQSAEPVGDTIPELEDAPSVIEETEQPSASDAAPDQLDSDTSSLGNLETENDTVPDTEAPSVPTDIENRGQEEVPSEQSSVEQSPVVVQIPEPALTESEVMEAPVETVRLTMTFSDDCWIQVTDGAGNRLASALRREGDSLDVSGQPPLRVVVGAMSAVESLEFQGEPMDLGNFRVVNNRSEFTLEP